MNSKISIGSKVKVTPRAISLYLTLSPHMPSSVQKKKSMIPRHTSVTFANSSTSAASSGRIQNFRIYLKSILCFQETRLPSTTCEQTCQNLVYPASVFSMACQNLVYFARMYILISSGTFPNKCW